MAVELRSFFTGGGGGMKEDEDEAALDRLPTHDRMRTAVLQDVGAGGELVRRDVNLKRLRRRDRKLLMGPVLKMVEEDNQTFLLRLADRIHQVGLELPKIEVRFENLEVEGDAYVGSRALPTLFNATMNAFEGLVGFISLSPSKKKVHKILKGLSGILKPSRMALLLGPPGSGKTTFLQALAGKLDKKLRVSGKITYNGHQLSEFVPQRTCTYISQHDVHTGEMTVRETIDFSGRCLGVGTRYLMLSELSRREKDAGIKPDPEIDAFMKASSMQGQKNNVITDYILKVLGLDICADTIVGDLMRRGISGGQKKRLTTGEMLAAPARVLFMDEISTGLDSSTTFEIVKFIAQMVHVMDGTVLMSLLQPAPETFDLFDDIILFSEGRIIYQGPRGNILEFFELMGFKCPERKAVPDFLQEVTSRKDQEQYWSNKKQPYRYISVVEFAESFETFLIGEQLSKELTIPFDKSSSHPAALERKKYGISSWELFKACLSREWLLMKRNSFVYVFKTAQITIMSVVGMTVFLRTKMHHNTIADGGKYFGALFYSLVNVMFNGMAEIALTIFRLPVFFKQRDFLFYPPWAFGLSYMLLKIPLSILESGIWVVLTYYVMGFAPAFSRFLRQLLAFVLVHQMSLSLFRFLAVVGRTVVVSNTIATFALLLVFVLGGFIISKDNIAPWWIWGYWISPMMYGQNAIAINEFLDQRWSKPNYDTTIPEQTIGKAILRSRGMFVDGHWYWISLGAVLGFALLYNALFILALTYLRPLGNVQVVMVHEVAEKPSYVEHSSNAPNTGGKNVARKSSGSTHENANANANDHQTNRGMVLPFQPLSLAFNHVNYYVDMPAKLKSQGIEENHLQLLRDVSGAFRPGVLTALVGVSGAGKTTLMDVLAGRKTGGNIEGSIYVSGYPKKQETFARVCGYCEQTDIHSPYVSVYESLAYSAWLRLAPEINQETRKMFVEEVMELVELNLLRDALVGRPGEDGLSTEQRKRLTVAVELVANPSIIFMDEPTTGLDARAAAIVMRTVRNTVDTGRTVVCTIHQPSIDIFESFDELLLLKRGGQVIYAGELGHHSHKLVEYFEAIPGIPKITEGYNPATWMLDITSPSVEARLNIDFADIYSHSSLYGKNQALIQQLCSPPLESKDLFFTAKHPQTFTTQCIACFWKHFWSYWRNPKYNAIRFLLSIVSGLMFGTIFWKKGRKLNTEQDLFNLLGGIYASVFFLGLSNANAVQPVIAIERTVFYRERAAGMYSSMAYAFAQVSVEIIYIAIQSIVYSIILFSMIGFTWQADKFFWFIYFYFMSFVCLTLYGMMVMSLTPSDPIAAIVSSFFMGFWNLFAGFILTRPMIPYWWRWFYWVTPATWTIYGIVASQLGDKDNHVQIPGQPSMHIKIFLKEVLGYERSFVGYAAIVHVGFILTFAFTFVFCIKYLNFQNR